MIKTITNDKHSQSISPENAKIIEKSWENQCPCSHILYQSDFASICSLRQVSKAFYNCSTQSLDGYTCSPLAKRSILCYNHYQKEDLNANNWAAANKIEKLKAIDFDNINKNSENKERKVLIINEAELEKLVLLASSPTFTTLFKTITKLVISCSSLEQNIDQTSFNLYLSEIFQNTSPFCNLSNLELYVTGRLEFTKEFPKLKTLTIGQNDLKKRALFILPGQLFNNLRTINMEIRNRKVHFILKNSFPNLSVINKKSQCLNRGWDSIGLSTFEESFKSETFLELKPGRDLT